MAVAYRIGPFRLDPEAGLLFRDAERVPLGHRAVTLLRVLAEQPGVPISKEALIEAAWPGLSVEESNLTVQIAGLRRVLAEAPGGARWIETLPRRGYRFAGPVARQDDMSGQTQTPIEKSPGLPDRPSIAVLPFQNLSGDPEQDYFADGMVEDIITELSRFSELLVIARNSSFTYKGKVVDIRQVARDLGVGYVLEGSVRRGGNRIRIAAQLIDGASGGHRWAERYDRELRDIFSVQDEVVRTIVGILSAHVKKAETERLRTKPPSTWQAYDYYLQAVDRFGSYMSSFNLKDLYETRRLLEHSLSIDPNYARSYDILANTHVTAWISPLDEDFLKDATLERAYKFAGKAVQLDPNLPQAHACFGLVLSFKHRHETAIAAFEKAVALNPNFSDFRFGLALVYAGNPRRAIDLLKAYMRLDPFYTPIASGYLGFAHYMLGQYAEALPVLEEHVARAPRHRSGHVVLAATHAQLGQAEEARVAVAEVLRLQPDFTIGGTAKRISKFRYDKDEAHFFDGLRKAGLPE